MSESVIDDHVIAEVLHLHEQLRAMRHMRSSVLLARPTGQLAQRLLDDLLRLPDHYDPSHWLQQEALQSTTLLALGLLVDSATQLKQNAAHLRRLQNMSALSREPILINQYAGLFGELLSASNWDTELTTLWAEKLTDRAVDEDLLMQLEHLRHQSNLPVEISPQRSLLEPGYQTLLADILRLPATYSPLQWLQEHRSVLCSHLVLSYLIHKVCPSPDFLQDKLVVRPALHPKAHLHIKHRLSIRIQKVEFFEQSFAIHMDVRIYTPRERVLPQNLRQTLPLQWEGFNRIIDDRGYYYLTHVSNCRISNQLWWWSEELTLLCYPSVENAHELILESQPLVLAKYGIPSLGDELYSLPGPILGNLTYHLRLSS